MSERTPHPDPEPPVDPLERKLRDLAEVRLPEGFRADIDAALLDARRQQQHALMFAAASVAAWALLLHTLISSTTAELSGLL